MPAKQFFWMREASHSIHKRRMSELADIHMCSSQPREWYYNVKAHYRTGPDPDGPPPGFEDILGKPVAGNAGQAAMIDLFPRMH